MWRAGLIAAGLAVQAAPAGAACRLALALAMDVSGSVDWGDYQVQRKGLLAALSDPTIRRAFLASGDFVAFGVYEWSGRGHQEIVVDWTEVRAEADIDRIAGVIEARSDGGYGLPTAIGYALDFGREFLGRGPDCAAHTLDVSGDGRNNDGMTPADAYRREDFGDILVNALAIGGHETDITIYYGLEVIRGPGAFVEVAKTHQDFPQAIRRKLQRELAEQVIGSAPWKAQGG